jgi:hypothetical protein
LVLAGGGSYVVLLVSNFWYSLKAMSKLYLLIPQVVSKDEDAGRRENKLRGNILTLEDTLVWE